MSTTSFEIKYK